MFIRLIVFIPKLHAFGIISDLAIPYLSCDIKHINIFKHLIDNFGIRYVGSTIYLNYMNYENLARLVNLQYDIFILTLNT